MPKVCPRCGAAVSVNEANHEYHCLEHHLVALYKIGVQRGLEGEQSDGLGDEQGAELIGRILEMANEWRASSRDRHRGSDAAAALATARRAQGGADLDTLVARFLEWRDVGWLFGAPVSGEAAWLDPRVIRRRYTQRLDDAAPVLQHALLKPYELLRVHRQVKEAWEWHLARKDGYGGLETLVVAPTAPLAICHGALKLAGLGAHEGRVG